MRCLQKFSSESRPWSFFEDQTLTSQFLVQQNFPRKASKKSWNSQLRWRWKKAHWSAWMRLAWGPLEPDFMIISQCQQEIFHQNHQTWHTSYIVLHRLTVEPGETGHTSGHWLRRARRVAGSFQHQARPRPRKLLARVAWIDDWSEIKYDILYYTISYIHIYTCI